MNMGIEVISTSINNIKKVVLYMESFKSIHSKIINELTKKWDNKEISITPYTKGKDLHIKFSEPSQEAQDLGKNISVQILNNLNYNKIFKSIFKMVKGEVILCIEYFEPKKNKKKKKIVEAKTEINKHTVIDMLKSNWYKSYGDFDMVIIGAEKLNNKIVIYTTLKSDKKSSTLIKTIINDLQKELDKIGKYNIEIDTAMNIIIHLKDTLNEERIKKNSYNPYMEIVDYLRSKITDFDIICFKYPLAAVNGVSCIVMTPEDEEQKQIITEVVKKSGKYELFNNDNDIGIKPKKFKLYGYNRDVMNCDVNYYVIPNFLEFPNLKETLVKAYTDDPDYEAMKNSDEKTIKEIIPKTYDPGLNNNEFKFNFEASAKFFKYWCQMLSYISIVPKHKVIRNGKTVNIIIND